MSTVSRSLISSPVGNLCSERYSYNNGRKVPLFENLRKVDLRLRKSWKLGVNYNGYHYFTSPCHPLESELPMEVMTQDDDNGIGIVKFFQGKNIFITGATGLVGKALVEKLLRSTSVGKIYILLKADTEEAALAKLSKQIIHSELLGNIREKYGSSYEEFAHDKLIPVVGNICEPNLGMDIRSSQAIMDDVDVIIGSAANTTLNGRYDSLLNANMFAPQRLMRFAKQCRNLKLFVHISTAYVSGRKEGVIYEKPLIMGENGRKEDGEMLTTLFPHLDPSDEINLAMKSCGANTEYDVTKDLKRLGRERATFYGWHNAYHMTKAMGEMVLNEIRGEIPLLIIRPSVIEGTYQEPLSGWIQGNRMYDPVIISYGKGLLPGYLANPDAHVDIIPVDMVANTTIVAIAKHGCTKEPGINVYHAATDFVNPLRYSDFFEYIYEHFCEYPLTNSDCINKMALFDEFNDFSNYIRDEMSERTGLSNVVGMNGKEVQRVQKQYKAMLLYAEQLCKMYEFAGFFKARFHTGNTRKLLHQMSKEEQCDFQVDATTIDWRKYFVNIHIPGLRKHVLGDAIVSE